MFNLSNFFNTPDVKRFCVRTCLLEGEGSRNLLPELLDFQRPGVMVVDSSFLADPFVQGIHALARGAGTPLLGVQGEPTSTSVDACLQGLPERTEWVLAVGGGSSIDTAKAIVAKLLFGEYRRVGYEQLRNIGELPAEAAPRFVAVPTTAGSGSETSRYYLVSDAATGVKQVSRSWRVCPEFAVLDPYFLGQAPPSLLLAGAFDTFVHHWETLVCRYESAPLVQFLALEGIASALVSIETLGAGETLSPQSLLVLQRASALGGMALSNVRSGFMHTAGEALAKQAPLAHPHTLMVFFEAVMGSYQAQVAIPTGRILRRLDAEGGPALASLHDLIEFWQQRFEAAGLLASIGRCLQEHRPDPASIVQSVLADQVLVSKEHPAPLDETRVTALVAESLSRALGWAP